MKKVLIICEKFPTPSQTFVRNHVDLLCEKKDFEVDIYAKNILVKNDISKEYDNQIGLFSNVQKIFLFPYFFLRHIFYCPKLIFESINFFRYGKEALLLSLFYAVVFLKEKNYDSIICHFGRPGNVGAFIKENWLKDAKLFCIFHGQDIREGIKSNGKIYQNLFDNVDKILSISGYNYKYLKKWGAKNIVHHPNGVNLNFFKRTHNLKKNGKKIRILSVGRLVPEKGYYYALNAIKKIIERNPSLDITYNIVGDGPLKNDIKKIIKEKGIEENVFLLGCKNSKQIRDYYNESDIFLLTSVSEALPVVVLEAAACELPIVATDVGSVSEEVEDGESGYLVESGNVKEIYKKLNILVSDSKKRRSLGRRGRKIVSNKYDLNKLNKVFLKYLYQ
jgi:colanic acid/amylovoran biosynthesis glycosyltransferase